MSAETVIEVHERRSTADRPATPPPVPTASTALAAVRIAACALLIIALLHDVFAAIDQSRLAADFASYYLPAHALLRFPSVNVYNIAALQQLNATYQFVPVRFFAYIYPPAALYAVMPFALFSYPTAQTLWMVVSHLAALGSALLLADAFAEVVRQKAAEAAPESLLVGIQRVLEGTAIRIGRWRVPIVPISVCAAAVLFAYPTVDTYDLGQINLLVLFFLMLALHSHLYDRPVLAGFAVAVAGALKLTPLIFLAYFVARGAWKAVASGLAFSVFFAAVPLILLSPQAYVSFLAQLKMVDANFVPDTQNQSLVGALMHLTRLFVHQGSHVLDLTQQAGEALGIILGAASIGCLVVVAWRRGELAAGGPSRAQRHDLDWLGFAFVSLAFLLVTPLVWTHLYVVALPAALMLAVYPLLRTRRAGEGWDRTDTVALFCGLLALSLFMVQLPMNFDHGLGPSWYDVGLVLLMLRAVGILLALGAIALLLAPSLRR